MASLKEVKNRIVSVKSTRQITSAMKMVASAKLHKAQSRIQGMLPYQQRLDGILSHLLGATTQVNSPFVVPPAEVHRVAIAVFASNGSLCGAFNSNVARLLEQALQPYRSLPKENVLVYAVGKKAEEAARKLGYPSQGSYQALADKPDVAGAYALARQLQDDFVRARVDRVELVYHHFKSMGSQVLTHETYLPFDLAARSADASSDAVSAKGYYKDYIVEPSVEELIATLLPKVLSQKIYTVLLDSNASEHAARTMAMQTATDNANDLIQELTKQYNKSRQQAITNELLDIVGGSMK